jgi:peptide subunit release factor 1 (eRF1)
MLTDLRRELEFEEGGSPDYEAALKQLSTLVRTEGFFPGKGWVAFVGPKGVHHEETAPFRPPNQVRWDRGAHLAPYLRGLRQLRNVQVALADRRRARFFTFVEGVLEEQVGMTAMEDVGDVSDAGVRKRASRHSGVRGATAKDLARRFLDVEAERLHEEVANRIREAAGSDGLVLLGGPSETVSRIRKLLGDAFEARTRVLSEARLDQTTSQLREGVGDLTSELSRALQEEILDEVMDRVGAKGKARMGSHDTRKMLKEKRADMLLLSDSRVFEDPYTANALVGEALDQSARVELLVGDAGARLDEGGEGYAVLLRY